MPPGLTLDGEARLGTSESDRLRWTLINALPVALGESQSADTVKGGIARAPACCDHASVCFFVPGKLP